MKRFLVILLFYSLSSFGKGLKTNFIIFGDSGYHQSFAKKKEGSTLQEFKQEALEEGEVKKNQPLIPPLVVNPYKKKYFFEEGGSYYVGRAMTKFCKVHSCQHALMLGDNIYPSGAQGDAEDESRFRQLIYLPFKNIQKNNKNFKFYVIMGNHDWYSHQHVPKNISRMAELSYAGIYSQMEYYARPGSRFILNPASTDPKRKTYYNFATNKGEIEYFALDTTKIISGLPVKDPVNIDKLAKNYLPTTMEEVDGQIKWLEHSLTRSKAKWKIVFGHHPLYSVGGSKWQEALSLREKLLDTLCKFADIYIAGHEHDLEYHSVPCGDKTSLELVVSGAASKQRSVGVNPSSLKLIKEQKKLFKFAKGMIWGFAHMTINGNSAKLKLLQVDKKGSYRVIFSRSFKKRNKTYKNLPVKKPL